MNRKLFPANPWITTFLALAMLITIAYAVGHWSDIKAAASDTAPANPTVVTTTTSVEVNLSETGTASAEVVVPASSRQARPAADAPAARPFTVVCFGDSITGHRPGEPYLHQYLKWSDLLGLMIEARSGRSDVRVLNRGFGGDKTYADPRTQTPGAVHRLQAEVLDNQPDIAVVLIGGNDRKQTDEERRVTADNLDQMVKRMLDADIKVLLLQYAVLPNPESPERTWRHLSGNNDLIAQTAERHNVPTLALQPYFDRAIRHQPHRELMNPVDGVHLAPGGEIVLARAVFGKLVSLGWVKAGAD